MGAVCSAFPIVIQTHANVLTAAHGPVNVKPQVRDDRVSEVLICTDGAPGRIYNLQFSAVLFDPATTPQWADFVIDKSIVIVKIKLFNVSKVRRAENYILTNMHIDWGNLPIMHEVPLVSSLAPGVVDIYGVLSDSTDEFSLTDEFDKIVLHATLEGTTITLKTDVSRYSGVTLDAVAAMYRFFETQNEIMATFSTRKLSGTTQKISGSSAKSCKFRRASSLDIIEEEHEFTEKTQGANTIGSERKTEEPCGASTLLSVPDATNTTREHTQGDKVSVRKPAVCSESVSSRSLSSRHSSIYDDLRTGAFPCNRTIQKTRKLTPIVKMNIPEKAKHAMIFRRDNVINFEEEDIVTLL